MKKTLIAVFLVMAVAVPLKAQGTLICGAYIQENKDYAKGIADYETLCNAENSIYLINVNSDYPHNEVLECYAQNKIPMLLLSDDYNMGKVSVLAEKAGEYNLPLYICINCGENLDFYKYCVDIFRIKAPRTKFVQAVAMADYNYTFAGVDCVDYLAINATIGSGNVDYAFLQTMAEQADVPVMFNLAVSHYNQENHRYYLYEAMSAIDYIYGLKAVLGDKLFGINYINVDYADQKFGIYDNEKLRLVYSGEVCEWGNSGFNLSNFPFD